MEGGGSGYAPQVDMMGMSVKSSTANRAVVDVHFAILNPHPVELQLVEVEFAFEEEDGDAVEKQALVKLVQCPGAVQPCSSTLMVVPVEADIGHIVSHTMRAQLNFRQSSTISDFFTVSVGKVKDFVKVLQPESRLASAYVNGVHISSLSPKEVKFSIILRVSNGNTIPVELERAEFTLEKEEDARKLKVAEKVVGAPHTISAKSQKRIEIGLTVGVDEMKAVSLPAPGNMLSLTLRMDFWFKDSSHGGYKISQEKSVSFPVLAPVAAQVKEVVFEHDPSGAPVARMQLQLRAVVSNPIKLSAKPLLDYTIRRAGPSGEAVAKLTSWSSLGQGDATALEEGMEVEMVLQPLDDSAFGSALWDVFCDRSTAYTSSVTIVGNSLEYGTVTM